MSKKLQYAIVATETGEASLTVFRPGEPPLSARDDHPNYDKIVRQVLAGDPEGLDELFDVAIAVAQRFEQLSDRVAVRGGVVYLDGDPVDNTLTKQIVRFLDEDVDDWVPLVNFFEKVLANPDDHSREQLYAFLNAHDFTITPDGDIVGYKGVRGNAEDGYRSIQAGFAIVNGEEVNGNVPNNLGDTVEMPRSKVTHDPSRACAYGLHVATHHYASTWTNVDAVLEVEVNPRDVVSVPNDHGAQKVRVCRYTVVDEVEAPHNTALRF